MNEYVKLFELGERIAKNFYLPLAKKQKAKGNLDIDGMVITVGGKRVEHLSKSHPIFDTSSQDGQTAILNGIMSVLKLTYKPSTSFYWKELYEDKTRYESYKGWK